MVPEVIDTLSWDEAISVIQTIAQPAPPSGKLNVLTVSYGQDSEDGAGLRLSLTDGYVWIAAHAGPWNGASVSHLSFDPRRIADREDIGRATPLDIEPMLYEEALDGFVGDPYKGRMSSNVLMRLSSVASVTGPLSLTAHKGFWAFSAISADDTNHVYGIAVAGA